METTLLDDTEDVEPKVIPEIQHGGHITIIMIGGTSGSGKSTLRYFFVEFSLFVRLFDCHLQRVTSRTNWVSVHSFYRHSETTFATLLFQGTVSSALDFILSCERLHG